MMSCFHHDMKDIIAVLIALVHVYIFVLESVLWKKPHTNKIFKVSPEQAIANRDFAFNQGFYNLFLSIEILLGLGLFYFHQQADARWLIDFAVASIFFAGLVLLMTGPGRMRSAGIQAIPSLAYFFFRVCG